MIIRKNFKVMPKNEIRQKKTNKQNLKVKLRNVTLFSRKIIKNSSTFFYINLKSIWW
jgi:hypothetical protein